MRCVCVSPRLLLLLLLFAAAAAAAAVGLQLGCMYGLLLHVLQMWLNLLVPMALSGTLVGVLLNSLSPPSLLLLLLLLLLGALCCRSLLSAVRMYQQEEETRNMEAFDVVSFQTQEVLRGAPRVAPIGTPRGPPTGVWGPPTCGGDQELQLAAGAPLSRSSSIDNNNNNNNSSSSSSSTNGKSRALLLHSEAIHRMSPSDALLETKETPRDLEPLSLAAAEGAAAAAAAAATDSGSSSRRSDGETEQQQQQQQHQQQQQLLPQHDYFVTANIRGPSQDEGTVGFSGAPLVVSLDTEDRLLPMTHICSFASQESEGAPAAAAGGPASPGGPRFSLGRGWWRRAKSLLTAEEGAPNAEFLVGLHAGGPHDNISPFAGPAEEYFVQPPQSDACVGGPSSLAGEGDRSLRSQLQPQQQQQQRQGQGVWCWCVASAAAALLRLKETSRRLLSSSPVREPQHHILSPLLLFVVGCSMGTHALIDRGCWGSAVAVAAAAATAGAGVQLFVSLAVLREFKAAHPHFSFAAAASAAASAAVLRLASRGRALAACYSNACSRACRAAARGTLRGLRAGARLLQQQQQQQQQQQGGHGVADRRLQERSLLEARGPPLGSVEMETLSGGAPEGGPRACGSLSSVPLSPPFGAAVQHEGESTSAEEAELLLRALLAAPVVGILTGVLAGLLGIGGGLIFSPVLLLLQLDPVVAVATSSACVVYTSSATTLQFLLLGRLYLLPCLIFGTTAAAAAAAGCLGVHAIRRLCAGRRSFVAFLVAAAVAVATLMTVRRYFTGGPV